MTNEQILKEFQRLKGWQGEGAVLVAINKGDSELATFYIGKDDNLEIADENDSVKVWCIEDNDTVPTMIRIVYEDVKSVKYFTPEEVKKLHQYECDLLTVELTDGCNIEFTSIMYP